MADTVRCDVCDVPVKLENQASHMRRVHPNVPFTPTKEQVRPRAPPPPVGRKVAFVVIVVVALAGVGWLVSKSLNAPLDPNAVQVRISMSGWNPASLETTVGTPVKIDVIATDDAHGAGHDFRIDELGINEYIGSGQKVFTLPAGRPGEYTWYCSLCCGGRDSPSMLGTYSVKA